ncbi:MAG: hypothetical protein D6775_11120 [Caldilineae bacterium]|nr:MAG: hypothetical protein D6775_11120 [Caldilineae bacterium]
MNVGRISGVILLIVAVVILVAAAALLGVQAVTEETATVGGQLLGFVIVLVFVVIPIGAIGAYLLMRGRAEETAMAKAREQRKILNMVLTQGKVSLDEIVFELNKPRPEVEDMVRDLVGKQLFTGAINWKDGILYSKEAAQLKADRKCPNCGGELELAGRGVIECPWCGSEVFLHID